MTNKKILLRFSLLLIGILGIIENPQHLSAQSIPDSLRMSKIGQVTYDTTLNDVWGYVDSTGREYALVGTGSGPSIVDLADPSQPQKLFFYPKPYSLWRDLVVRRLCLCQHRNRRRPANY